MNNRSMPALVAGLTLFLLAVAPSANAASGGSASTSCTMTSASADGAGSNPSATAQMFGETYSASGYQNSGAAHYETTGTGGSTATADGGSFHSHCNAHNPSGGGCGVGGTDKLKIFAFTSSADTANAVPVTQETDYNGFVGYVPSLASFWFFGTVSHDGVMTPFAAPVPSSGTLTLTPTTASTMAPFALNVVDCMPVGVGLVSVH